jgi:two-component system, NarL family, response regulator DegU
MSDKVRIVIADDHPIFRRGLRHSVEEAPGMKVVGEASNGKQALELIRQLNPDVAIVDISMPVLDGFAVARELAEENSETKLVFLTAHQEESLFDEAMAVGVNGYMLKESSMDEIVSCIDAVAQGKHYTSPALTSYLMTRTQRRPDPAVKRGLEDLTPTERRVLKLIADYKTSREIAEELFVSYYTVETHRRNICEKLDLHGSHALMKFALAHLPDLS